MRLRPFVFAAALLVAGPLAAQPAAFAPLDLPAPTAVRAADGRPGPAYWQNRNDYRIEVSLDPATHTVAGTVTLTYTNQSPLPLDHLWFHLEQNLFAPGARGASGRRASATVAEGQGYRIGRVTVGGREVVPTITDTRMRVDLREPVAGGGGTVTVTVPYSFVVPGDRTPRMGRMETARGTVYALAQWFPRVAVYDDVTGWNHQPYLGQGEFYLGYGDIEMALTVPATMTVVGTGTLLNEAEVYTAEQRERLARARESDTAVRIVEPAEVGTAAARPRTSGMTTWRFRAENVRDVAWAASNAFILDGAVARVPQPGGRTNDVLILSAYPHEGLSADPASPGWEEATRYGRAAILNNSRWYAYPYPVAISVATHIGGMEYPMLHFSDVQSRHFDLFGVVDHELGHNWFPMIVGSDERRYGWMDEGFNTFINRYSNVTFYNEGTDRSLPGFGRANDSYFVNLMEPATYANFARGQAANDRPLMTYPDHVPGAATGFVLYFKPAMALTMLREHILGPERFDAAFRAYIATWAYKHPQPADFYRSMEGVAGEDLDWFWRGWFYTTDLYDARLLGVVVADGDRAVATVATGPLPMPTTVEFRFTDGSTARAAVPVEAFATTGETTVGVPLNGRTLAGATLDPDQRLPDADRANDAATPM